MRGKKNTVGVILKKKRTFRIAVGEVLGWDGETSVRSTANEDRPMDKKAKN